MNTGSQVRLVEVSPRDGLQNEKTMLPPDIKIALIDRLSATGLKTIETTSFVSARWVPQLADAAEVFRRIRKVPGVTYPVLVPNEQGYRIARESGHVVMSNGKIRLIIPRHNPINAITMGHIAKAAGLTPDQFRDLL